MATRMVDRMAMGKYEGIATLTREKTGENPITPIFIRRHAKILSQLSGGRLKAEDFIPKLKKYENDPLKFDCEFYKLRKQVLDELH